jgi:chromosomal replication initiator protein
VRVSDIQAAVARHYGLPVEELTGECRKRIVARPRQIAMRLAHLLTEHSTVRIGQFFGRDHSTVIHARKAITRLRADPEIHQAMRVITLQLLIERQGACA